MIQKQTYWSTEYILLCWVCRPQSLNICTLRWFVTLRSLTLFVTQAVASNVSERWACFFYFFGLITDASVFLFFFGFILIEWYFYVWCNMMKTYIINRLHHGFKEYCCFVIPLGTMILRLSNGPNVYLFITFIGFFVSYNLEQKKCSLLRDFHYKHRPSEPWKSLLLPLSFYSENFFMDIFNQYM